ncbi:RPM1-interacting protein 4 isoform X1 [Morus notabilis]|uniref:RPM1-interacting protein 4 isoform X1 n=1 Tax=Morus notabilis TaxID=981085 RepID=UPI000CED55C0|nr:RPM1-interacting protein 4 isoform X1 [Morus notabilis]
MMQNSHVPKFGNWENEDIPYTAYFENARKDKPVGNVKINPNDPEENPEAFMMMMMMQRRGSSRSQEGNISSHHNPDSSVLPTAAVQPPRRLMKSASAEKSRHAEHRAHHRNGIADTNTNYSSTNTTLGNNHKSPASESGSDQKTSSDNSLLNRPNQGRYVRSDDYKKKTSTTSSGRGSDSSSSASEQGHHRRQRSSSTNHSSDHQQHQHHRAASIPEFGSWDVNDPKAGEGFTVIFNKMKEEKQNYGAIEVPTMPPPRPPTNHLKDRSKRSCVSKICCCMSSSGSE